MIEVNVKGLEQLQSLITRLSLLPTLEIQIYEIFYEVMLQFYNDIKADPNIPEKYKEGVIYVWYPPTFIVTYYVPEVWEKAKQEKAFTTRAEWIVYQCVKRGYFGGELKGVPEYLEATYIEDKWNREKEKYIDMIRNRVIELIRSALHV
jgi:hypothetical protein